MGVVMTDISLDDLLTDPPATTATVHALKPTSVVGNVTGSPITLNRGDNLEVTPHLRQLNTDRAGRCCLDRTDLFAPGPAPADMLPVKGSAEWDDLHKARREAAWRIQDRTEREAELAQVRAQFGSLNPSRTLRESPGI